MDIIYDLLGAFVGSYIIFNLFCMALFKILDKKSLLYVSFIGSAILILIITNFTMGMETGFLMYIPALFIWFVLDLVKVSRKDKINKAKEAPLE